MPVDLRNLSIAELKRIKRHNQQELKKEYSQYKKKQKLIDDVKKIEKVREKLNPNPKPKPKPKPNTKPIPTKIKKFEEYFQECIKNKTIPPDTPSYLRKALEQALKDYDQGIIKEKSALEDFANKYIIKGDPGVTPFEFLKNEVSSLKGFLRNHRNIKVRYILVCLLEKLEGNKKFGFTVQDKAYFNSDTHINLESTDVKEILAAVIYKILEKIGEYQKNGSGWYFKEVVRFKIHTVEYKPMRGSSYIPLPDLIMGKKAIVNIRKMFSLVRTWISSSKREE